MEGVNDYEWLRPVSNALQMRLCIVDGKVTGERLGKLPVDGVRLSYTMTIKEGWVSELTRECCLVFRVKGRVYAFLVYRDQVMELWLFDRTYFASPRIDDHVTRWMTANEAKGVIRPAVVEHLVKKDGENWKVCSDSEDQVGAGEPDVLPLVERQGTRTA